MRGHRVNSGLIEPNLSSLLKGGLLGTETQWPEPTEEVQSPSHLVSACLICKFFLIVAGSFG